MDKGGQGWTNRDCQVIATCELCDLTDIPETSTHHNRVVAMFLIIVVDGVDALDPRILRRAVVLFC